MCFDWRMIKIILIMDLQENNVAPIIIYYINILRIFLSRSVRIGIDEQNWELNNEKVI